VDPPGLHSEPPGLNFVRLRSPRLKFEPLNLLNFDFNADPDPSFTLMRVQGPDPDPAFINNADPDSQPSSLLLKYPIPIECITVPSIACMATETTQSSNSASKMCPTFLDGLPPDRACHFDESG
jgi:hypothetical protein